jgi:predicted transcriptional regulator
MTNKFLTTLTVNLDQSLYDKLQSEADRTYSTKTQVMRRLISEIKITQEA